MINEKWNYISLESFWTTKEMAKLRGTLLNACLQTPNLTKDQYAELKKQKPMPDNQIS